MDKAGEAMLEGMVFIGIVAVALVVGTVWLVRRAARNRRAKDAARPE